MARRGPLWFGLAATSVVAVLPLGAPLDAADASVTITGSTPQNYTVLLVSRNGDSTVVPGGKFRLKVTKTRATGASLHLVTKSGSYAGPVVLKFDKKKGTANTQLSGKSGDVGKIAMLTGYSVAAAKKTTAIQTRTTISVTSRGKPAGAGTLGLTPTVSGGSVRKVSVSTADDDRPPGEDTDKDGIPNTIDLDDDADGRLDIVDASNPSKSALTTRSIMFLDISKTINLHAGMTETDMQSSLDAVLQSNNNFSIHIRLPFVADPAQRPDGVHVSCAAEVKWCAPGTPATLFGGGILPDANGKPGPVTKWVDMKADGFPLSLPFGSGPNCDATVGLPTMTSANPACKPPYVALSRQIIPQLPSADVKAGGLFTVNFTRSGRVARSITGTLAPYFTSVPAVKEVLSNGQTRAVDYALKGFGVDPKLGEPPTEINTRIGAYGTKKNPFLLGADRTLTVTFWRPQRSGVTQAGEGRYVDMGGLRYGFHVHNEVTNNSCPADAYSGLSSGLTNQPTGALNPVTPLLDASRDSVPDRSVTISFTVDLSRCVGGADIGTTSQLVSLIASSPSNGDAQAYQDFYLKLG